MRDSGDGQGARRTHIRGDLNPARQVRCTLHYLSRRVIPMATTLAAVHSDPDILGGKPVFVGTRVPFQALVDYIAAGRTLDEFLDDFPSVSRDLAVRSLQDARDALRASSARR